MGGIATNHLAMLRQRVERQRSVNLPLRQSMHVSSDDVSVEEKEVENTKRHSVENLDSQISTLHQDVAALSIEVRNAIQALQEMKTPSSGVSSSFNAISNPNLARAADNFGGNGVLARSSSHPPEMFCWDPDDTPLEPLKQIRHTVDTETQTDEDLIRDFVLQNSEKIMQFLGLSCDKHRQCRLKKSYSVSDDRAVVRFDRNTRDKEGCTVNIEEEEESSSLRNNLGEDNGDRNRVQIFGNFTKPKIFRHLKENNYDV